MNKINYIIQGLLRGYQDELDKEATIQEGLLRGYQDELEKEAGIREAYDRLVRKKRERKRGVNVYPDKGWFNPQTGEDVDMITRWDEGKQKWEFDERKLSPKEQEEIERLKKVTDQFDRKNDISRRHSVLDWKDREQEDGEM